MLLYTNAFLLAICTLKIWICTHSARYAPSKNVAIFANLANRARYEGKDPLQSPVHYMAGASFPLGEAKVIALPRGRVRARSETEGKRGRVSLLFRQTDPLQSPTPFNSPLPFRLRFRDLRPRGGRLAFPQRKPKAECGLGIPQGEALHCQAPTLGNLVRINSFVRFGRRGEAIYMDGLAKAMIIFRLLRPYTVRMKSQTRAWRPTRGGLARQAPTLPA